MNISEEKIIDAIKDGSNALMLAKEIKEDMKSEFHSLKESIRYDLQNIVSSDVQFAVVKGLEAHYDKVARPHIEKVSEKSDKINERVLILESDKKAIKWIIVAITGLVSTVWQIVSKFFH